MAVQKRNHSVCDLNYHLVLVTKYRKPCISPELGNFLVREAKRVIEATGGFLEEGNFEVDHIHLLLMIPPTRAVSEYVATLKNTLSRLARRDFAEQINQYLWKDTFWSASYYLSTTGGANLDVVKAYIEKQGMPKRPYKKRVPFQEP